MASLKQIIEANGQSFDDIIDSDPESLLRALCGDTTYLNEVEGVSLPQSALDASEPKGNLFCVWAEENGTIQNNGNEWSFGNGATGATIGIPLAVDAQLVAVTFNAEAFGTSVTMQIKNGGAVVYTSSHVLNNSVDTLSAPVDYSAGDTIVFRTGTLVGSFTDCRICAWFREV